MSPRLPTVEQILDIAAFYGMNITDEDAASFRGLMAGPIASYARLDQLAEPKLAVKFPRGPGYRPGPEKNKYQAWYWKTDIKGSGKGVLAGKTVAVKDNICVAGVPMMNGSRVLEGYVPEIDATVVTRVLEAGGTITGKAACEDLCFSAGSHTCATGPIRNPHNPDHSTGGSSGGSAALVAAKEVDMALGGDQGGSIRTPSCWCGVYGLKPTWGLVPMTGGMPISYSVDHCGPICGSTEDVARLLSAIAGSDGYDPRTTIESLGRALSLDEVQQCFSCHTTDYTPGPSGPVLNEMGIHCERCHGPGLEHVRLMAGPSPPPAGQDRKILNPAQLKAFAQIEMCGACHGKPPRDTDLSALQLSEPTPQMARYPSRRLVLSRCFSESADGLKCTSCHNPHINVSEWRALRDQPCIACHSEGLRAKARICPLQQSDCVSCHMPKERAMLHFDFTDHWIRVAWVNAPKNSDPKPKN